MDCRTTYLVSWRPAGGPAAPAWPGTRSRDAPAGKNERTPGETPGVLGCGVSASLLGFGRLRTLCLLRRVHCPFVGADVLEKHDAGLRVILRQARRLCRSLPRHRGGIRGPFLGADIPEQHEAGL